MKKTIGVVVALAVMVAAFAGTAKAGARHAMHVATAPSVNCNGASDSFTAFPSGSQTVTFHYKIGSQSWATTDATFTGPAGSASVLFSTPASGQQVAISVYTSWLADGGGHSDTTMVTLDCGTWPDSSHVTICHRTGSNSHPYVVISPDVSGVYNGHYTEHNEQAVYPNKADDGKWGDIIPPFVYQGQTYSLNWTDSGKAVYYNGCAPPGDSGTLQLVKKLNPKEDPGTFNLYVGDYPAATAVGDGGHSDVLKVSAGTYDISEQAASADYPLSDYTYQITCKSGDEVIGQSSSAGYQVTVGKDQNVVCTFTNTRIPPPQMGTLKVCKTLNDPTQSGDKFVLMVDGHVVNEAAGNGDCGQMDVTVGSHTASESAAGNANLDNYTVSYSESCPAGVAQVAYDTTTTCTITNTRKESPPAQVRHIYVTKECKDANGAQMGCPTGFFPFTLTCTDASSQPTVLYDGPNQLVGTCPDGSGGSVSEPATIGNWKNDDTPTKTFNPGSGDVYMVFVNQEIAPTSGSCPDGDTQISAPGVNPVICEKTVTQTVYGTPTCPAGSTQTSSGPGFVVCNTTTVTTVTQTVTVYGTPTCPAGSTQTSSGPGFVVCNTTTTITAPAGKCPAGYNTVAGSNPVQCTQTVTKVVVKKVPGKVTVTVTCKGGKKYVISATGKSKQVTVNCLVTKVTKKVTPVKQVRNTQSANSALKNKAVSHRRR